MKTILLIFSLLLGSLCFVNNAGAWGYYGYGYNGLYYGGYGQTYYGYGNYRPNGPYYYVPTYPRDPLYGYRTPYRIYNTQRQFDSQYYRNHGRYPKY